MTGRMREVELVDEVDVPVPPAPDGRAAPDTPGPWPRRHAFWLVPTALLVVAGLVGTQAVLDARERSRIEALAKVPGVVAPAGPDIGVIWRAPAELGPVLQYGAEVDGLLVGGVSGTDGVRVLALDPDTGASRWSTAVTLPTAHPQPDGRLPTSAVICTQIPHGDRPLAGCLSQQFGENIVGLPDQTIWVLDPTDGDVLSTRTVTGTSGVTFTRDAVVVASRVDAAGAPARADASSVRWNVAATDALDGTSLWSYTTPAVDVLGREDGPAGADASGGASMTTSGDDHVVLSVDTGAWILDDGGRLVRAVPLGPGSWIQGARAGAYVLSAYTASGTYSGELILADGTSAPIDQTAAWLAVDDGSAPDVVLTAGDGPTGVYGLSGRDVATGKTLWHDDDTVNTALLLHGVVYIATLDGISAVDARTGRVRWIAKLDHQFREMSTDGRYLLVPGRGISLDAYSLADGSHAWSADLRDAVTQGSPTQTAQGFQPSGREPRMFVWMNDGSVAVLG
ncbi:PQQ-binding-like beta-propeller repeat protein [Cellulomonas sp. McL0617]|uniref:outer membrane protein assembly factor BamB family protein n=1 Tax=Cellulomonas sp. McL0617 TaxID=3415675 RepID=UPI003CF6E9B9